MNITKKKKKRKKYTLGMFSEDVQKKARQSIQKLPEHKILRAAQKVLSPSPKQSAVENVHVKTQKIPGVGSTYSRHELDHTKGGDIDTLIRMLGQIRDKFRKGGASKICVHHRGIKVVGFRCETAAEFQQRVEATELKNAEILVARELAVPIKKEEEQLRTREEHFRMRRSLREMIRVAGIKGVREELDKLEQE